MCCRLSRSLNPWMKHVHVSNYGKFLYFIYIAINYYSLHHNHTHTHIYICIYIYINIRDICLQTSWCYYCFCFVVLLACVVPLLLCISGDVDLSKQTKSGASVWNYASDLYQQFMKQVQISLVSLCMFVIFPITHFGHDKITAICRWHFQMHFLEWKCMIFD